MNFKQRTVVGAILLAITPAVLASGLEERSPSVPAKSYQVVDISTDTILAESNPDERTEIASLTKIMTAYIVFSKIANGTVAMSDQVLISTKAWRSDGSRMFIEAGEKVTVENLLRGIIVVSGNDSAVALAEFVAGSEARFVDMMNEYAKALGMDNTLFANATGLPTKTEQYSSARDLATLSAAIFNQFPEFAHMFREKEFKYNDISQQNRNRLLRESESYTGLKTGYTERSGYSIVSGFSENDRNIVTVVLNSESVADRFVAAKTLTTFGYRRFKSVTPIKEGVAVTSIPVFYGDVNEIKVFPARELKTTLPLGIGSLEDEIHLVANLNKNSNGEAMLFAPISKKYVVGTLTAFHKNEPIGSVDLIVHDSVAEASPFKKLKDWMALKVNGRI